MVLLLLRSVVIPAAWHLVFLLDRTLFSNGAITEVGSSELKIEIFVGVLNCGIDLRYLPLVPLPPRSMASLPLLASTPMQ